jgi:hypothetical protein
VYRCQICGEIVPAKTSAIRQVVETRKRQYPFREKAHQVQRDRQTKKIDDPGGVGSEIVREILVCPACSKEPSEGRSEYYGEYCGPPALAIAA